MSAENKGMPAINVVVFADELDRPGARGFVAAATAMAESIGASVDALIIGINPGETYARDAVQAGAGRVTLISHPELMVPAHTDQLLALLEDILRKTMTPTQSGGRVSLCLFHADAVGEELAARLAARMDGTALGRCSNMEVRAGGLLVHKPVFGGRMDVVLAADAGPCFAVIRSIKAAGADAAAESADASGEAITHFNLASPLPAIEHITRNPSPQQRKRLEGARIIVSGGRGMQSPDGFLQLQQLADALGAALGGSLPAVDAGWAPVSHQVGQSGKYVTPELYVAVALSGTPQHMAGIGPDTDIVAINSDPEADIFSAAAVGVVADWTQLLPVLIERIRADKAFAHDQQ